MLQGTLMEYPWGEADSTKQQKRRVGGMAFAEEEGLA